MFPADDYAEADNAAPPPSVAATDWAGLRLCVRGGAGQRRRTCVVEAAGPLDYYSAASLQKLFRRLREQSVGQSGVRRVVLDLRGVRRWDLTGVAALMEIARDAERGQFALFIADVPSRPVYRATGLDTRLRFLSPRQVEAL